MMEDEMYGACSTQWETRNADSIFDGKPEGKRLLESPRRKWEGNIRMYLREIGWEGMDWIHLAQVRDQWVGSCCEHGNKPLGFKEGG
jgi:hypothetical protein